ncbi:MAG TPA: site-specific integrase [Firmicutes bacterium]|nr:site-specific integrase [Bacillota bacterium]
MEEAQKRKCYPLYLTAITMGMRVGEILALKWGDVDFESGTMRVDETLQRGGPNPVYGPVKTEGGVRVVKIPEYLVQVIREHQKEQKKVRLQLGSEWHDLGLVFTTWKGTAISPRNLHRQFKAMLKAAGLPETFRLHDLRHTSATLLIMSGVPVKTISARLGHSSTGITQDLYGHVLQAMEDQAASAMDRLFNPSQRDKKTKKEKKA